MSDRVMRRSFVRLAIALLAVCSALVSGCTVGPKYVRPSAAAPPAYKELTPENFKDTDPAGVTTAMAGFAASTDKKLTAFFGGRSLWLRHEIDLFFDCF